MPDGTHTGAVLGTALEPHIVEAAGRVAPEHDRRSPSALVGLGLDVH